MGCRKRLLDNGSRRAADFAGCPQPESVRDVTLGYSLTGAHRALQERSSKSTLTSLIHRDKLVVGSWSGVVFMDGEFTESVSPIGPSATRCESPAVRSTVYRYGERIMSFRAVFRLNGRWRKLYEGDLLTERSLRHHRQAARTRAG